VSEVDTAVEQLANGDDGHGRLLNLGALREALLSCYPHRLARNLVSAHGHTISTSSMSNRVD
jgi:hypothetical protein